MDQEVGIPVYVCFVGWGGGFFDEELAHFQDDVVDFFPCGYDVLGWDEEAVASAVAQLDLVCEAGVELVVEPV